MSAARTTSSATRTRPASTVTRPRRNTTNAVAVPPVEGAERADDTSVKLGDVVLEAVEHGPRQLVGEPDERLGDGDEADHPEDRHRQVERHPPQHPADVAGQDALDDPGEDEPDEQGRADRRRRGVRAVAGDEPVGLDVRVGGVEEEVEDPADDPHDGVDDPRGEPADEHLEARGGDAADEARDLVDRPADRVGNPARTIERVTDLAPTRSKPARASSNGSGSHGWSRARASGSGPAVVVDRVDPPVAVDPAEVDGDGQPVGLRQRRRRRRTGP